MTSLQVKIDGSATIRELELLISELPAAYTEALVTLGEVGAKSAKNTHWYKSRTGKLKENTSFILDGLTTGALVANTPYAGYVQFGNRPGGLGKYIYPRKAHALRFVIDGTVIFAKRVRSHGPLPFMTDASAEMIKHGNDVFVDIIGKVINRHQK